MDDKRLFDHDAASGTTEYFYGHGDGSFTIETVQDVTELVERNKYLSNTVGGKWGELSMVASYPLTILMDLVKQNILDKGFKVINEKGYKRWLNDSDNAVWRTRPGKV